MTASVSTTHADFHCSPDEAIKLSLSRVEEAVDAAEHSTDPDVFELLEQEFRRLHARIRTHHAVDCLSSYERGPMVPAEWTGEWLRLRAEHPHLLGQLDWLLRHIGSVADQPIEDREVFTLRVRELIAVLRRHDAEEDRLFALALWHDTGGES
jgi:hypothetical protein